jgi:4a-hydroxytetrahydrobiopterin dehydratase
MKTTWFEKENTLVKTLVFADFLQAIDFMQFVAPFIEKQQHHPEWKNIYNRIEIALTTHDAGNLVTEKDRALAILIDQYYDSFLDQL